MPPLQPLWEDIQRFSRHKYKFASVLIIAGLFGLIVPIIPGVLLIMGAVFLIKPEWYTKFKRFLNTFWSGK
jgi:uncharacterized protein YqgC (DUF456 family)